MYYHINDIIFLVRFPQFVGSLRRDVWTTAYWRDRPTRSTRHPYRLGLLCYRSAYRLLSYVTSFRFGLVEIARLTSRSYAVARKWVIRSANLRLVVTRKGGIVPRADEIEISFRLDGDTQLCINPGYGVRMHRKLARPSGPARVHFNY